MGKNRIVQKKNRLLSGSFSYSSNPKQGSGGGGLHKFSPFLFLFHEIDLVLDLPQGLVRLHQGQHHLVDPVQDQVRR